MKLPFGFEISFHKQLSETPAGSPLPIEYGGYSLAPGETSSLLTGVQRFREFENMAQNCAIVAAGLNLYMDTIGASTWTFIPALSDSDEAERLALAARRILMRDPKTPWRTMVGQAAMYRFNGYSVQNPVLRRLSNGEVTLDSLEVRPVKSIHNILKNARGEVSGFRQQMFNGSFTDIPIDQTVYIVDDITGGGPSGIGMFRPLYPVYYERKNFKELLAVGYETDLTGIPKVYMPLKLIGEAAKKRKAGASEEEIMAAQDRATQAVRNFVRDRKRSKNQFVILDSSAVTAEGDDKRPIALRQQDVSLMSLEASSFPDLRASIKESDREMAHIMGVEQIFLAENTQGSYRLADNQSQGLGVRLKNMLETVKEAFEKQLLTPIWELNNWPLELMPIIEVQLPVYVSPEAMAQAVSTLDSVTPGDEAVDKIRGLMGLPAAPEREQQPPAPQPNEGDSQ